MPEILIFLIGSAGLIYVSRSSLRAPRSHGFYRFFAWELILALFLLNVRRWFLQPLAPHQIVSWLLLIISLYLVIQGVLLLRRMGRPNPERVDGSLLEMEKTTSLVTSGLYRYIRHPLYSSLLFLAWGIFFKSPSWPGAWLAIAASACLALTAQAEEEENMRYFGQAYREYMQHSKMFIPFLF